MDAPSHARYRMERPMNAGVIKKIGSYGGWVSAGVRKP